MNTKLYLIGHGFTFSGHDKEVSSAHTDLEGDANATAEHTHTPTPGFTDQRMARADGFRLAAGLTLKEKFGGCHEAHLKVCWQSVFNSQNGEVIAS